MTERRAISLALSPGLLDAVDEWRASQEFPPTKREVFETALRDFLMKRTYPGAPAVAEDDEPLEVEG